jgi:hypothetical protein
MPNVSERIAQRVRRGDGSLRQNAVCLRAAHGGVAETHQFSTSQASDFELLEDGL